MARYLASTSLLEIIPMRNAMFALLALGLIACTPVNTAESVAVRDRIEDYADQRIAFDRLTDAQIISLLTITNTRDSYWEKRGRIRSLVRVWGA